MIEARKTQLLTPDAGPAEILAVARRCPALARAIHDSVDPPQGVDWPAVFCRFPRWERLEATVAEAVARPSDAGALRCAATTSAVAAETRWYSHERAFWAVLVDADPHNSNFERCLAVARRSLRRSTAGAPFWDVEVEPTHASSKYNRLALPNASAPLLRWDRPLIKRLKNVILSFSFRASLQVRELALAAATSSTWAELGSALLQLTERTVGGPAAVWLPTESEEKGLGFVGAAASAGACSQFEFEMPSYFRSSADLVHDGRRLGKLYYCTSAAPSFPWTAAVSAGVSRLRLQAKVDDGLCSVEQTAARLSKAAHARLRSAMAEFAAGAGHEINNPLGAIAGTVQMLLSDERAPARRSALIKIRDQVDRVHGMIRDLHFIGRTQRPEQRPLRLGAALAEAAAAVAALPIGRLSLAPIARDLQIAGCHRDVVRLFRELLANAIEAAGPTGSVRASCALTEGATRSAAVTIVDSGPGFTSEIRRHAFTPFYSGRSAGRGLGMGLPVARRIAEDHGAFFEIAEGTPTTVRVAFPLLEAEAGRRAA